MEENSITIPTPISAEQGAADPSTPPLKPRHLWKKILLGFGVVFFIVLIIVGIGTYRLAKDLVPSSTTNMTTTEDATKLLSNPVVKKMIEKLPLPKVTTIPITVTLEPTQPDLTSTAVVQTNWKTYQSSAYKFAINYPAGETEKETNHGLGVTDIVFYGVNNGSSAGTPDFQFLLFPKAVGDLIGQNFEQLYNLPSPSAQIMKTGSGSQQFTKIQNTTIDGLRAFTYQSRTYPVDSSEEPEVGMYIEMGDNVFTLSTGESNKPIFDSMISSFKYTP